MQYHRKNMILAAENLPENTITIYNGKNYK